MDDVNIYPEWNSENEQGDDISLGYLIIKWKPDLKYDEIWAGNFV